jgi:hypothetical protein
MKKAEHIVTFLQRLKRFTQTEGITSMLMVDKNNTVEDVFPITMTGGIIAEIDNAVGEIHDELYEYYLKAHNINGLKRLEKLNKR